MSGRTESTLRERFSRRLPRADDDRGSMAMLLLVMMIGMLVGALLVPMVITQDRATKFSTSRVHALDAAQSGIDNVLGQIRGAVDSSGVGTPSGLPCGPITGPVNAAGQAAYSVSIAYYTKDPIAYPSTPKMICSATYGTYDTASGAFTPSFALLASTGTDGAAVNGTTTGRTLTSTYVFKTSNTNIGGGVIRLYPADGSTQQLCLDAGSATPSVGATTNTVTLQSCSTTSPPLAQQVFVYRKDLTIQLLSSITSTNANGLCLDTNGTPTANTNVTLTKCEALGSPVYTHQWSFNDNGLYQTSTSSSATTGNLGTQCLTSNAQSIGQLITLQDCNGTTSSPTQAWIPVPSVGAGQATLPQWVDYQEFGRCLDVTGQNVNADHLIAYPCKQNPYPSSVTWNQKFSTSSRGNGKVQIYTYTANTNYCVTSTGTLGGQTIVRPCDSSNTLQNWTVNGGGSTLAYSDKYIVKDNAGFCLDLKGGIDPVWSALVGNTCTGSLSQKWNADPNLSVPALQNSSEK
jgi:hypothetical protein